MANGTISSPIHKPESMHYGRCPVCKKRRVCVLLSPREGGIKTPRRYYCRTHACGSRIEPVLGSLQALRENPESGSPSTLGAESNRERS